MKKIFVTESQFERLCEENTVNITAQAKGNDLSSFSNAATDTTTVSDINKAKSAGDVNLVISGPNASDDAPQQEINVAAGDTVQNAIATQGNSALLQQGGKMKITGDGFGESKIYTKKTIEEARLKRMDCEGRIFTKEALKRSLLKR